MMILDWEDGDERWLVIGVWHPRLARFMLNHGLAAALVAALGAFCLVALDPPHDYVLAAIIAVVMAGAMVLARGLVERKVRNMGGRGL